MGNFPTDLFFNIFLRLYSLLILKDFGISVLAIHVCFEHIIKLRQILTLSGHSLRLCSEGF